MARAKTLVVAMIALLCIKCSWAVQYQVGDSQGWDTTTDLKTWESNKTFKVGDSLVFQYSPAHSVAEVDKAGYDGCSPANAVASFSDGKTTIALSKAGKRYFICGTQGHCAGGMKLEVDILAATSPSPAPAKAPVSSSPSESPTPVATIPDSPTPKTTPSSSPVHTPVASPKAASGATTTATGAGFIAAVSAIVALGML